MYKEKTLNKFYKLTDAEEYFEFFELEYDEKLVRVKRFHILKEYGSLIKTGIQNLSKQEERLLDFLKYSLLKIYRQFQSGYEPSAVDVWDMFKDGKLSGCMACNSKKENDCGC